ncbi:hypothetical protein E7Z53_17990 [Kocuria salina]|uniref:Uncharacterized protein n=1 Tax=Kocuria rosea subsp. polaris TaxID=136273 RepID=A0A0W8I1T7_KOCRO|nr:MULTISPECIES: hypothetical protein [Kocuria]KUG51699.1 hypothetical protein AVL61_15770 [Kocuria polaris]NVC25312.1 hypothetical protein [Kocuria salina]
MAKLTDPQQAEEAAQRLLNDRMDYIRRAITARGALDEARDALKEAEKNDTAAFQAAVNNGGWTADELKKIGLAAPEKMQRVQRRRKTTQTTSGAHSSSAQNDGGTEPEQ